MLKNYLLSPHCLTSAPHLSLFQLSFSFSFSAAPSCFSVSALSVLFSVSALFWSAPSFFFFSFLFSTTFLVSLDVLPYFFQPKTILSSAQNVFFSAKPFSVQPKNIFFQFSPHYCFSFFFYLLALFSAPPSLFLFFLPFFSAFSHYVMPLFSPSVQLKTFFSCFMSLYLSKSSFSSNLK